MCCHPGEPLEHVSKAVFTADLQISICSLPRSQGICMCITIPHVHMCFSVSLASVSCVHTFTCAHLPYLGM